VAIKLSTLILDTSPHIHNQTFQVGDYVVLHSLSTANFNSRCGYITVGPDPSNEGRYCVQTDDDGKVVNVKPSNIRLHVRTTAELLMERQRIDNATTLNRVEVADPEMMALTRMMMSSFNEQMQMELYGRRIPVLPDFRIELVEEGGYPEGVDEVWAHDHLSISYENAAASPHVKEMSFIRPKYEPHPSEAAKRLGRPTVDKLQWYYSSRAVGDIYTDREDHVYPGSVRHNYSNQGYRRYLLHQGKTHVAVGFVDLGILFESDICPGGDWDEAQPQPLHFIGVERSAFSVAKTHVIWEMIRECAIWELLRDDLDVPDCKVPGSIDSVLQVWFSSTWTSFTEHLVKAVFETLCQPERQYHKEVRQTLEHWKRAPTMSLKQARKAHIERISKGRSSIGKMKMRKDRMAIACYELTGDFAVGETPTCGNILMFDCPDFTPPPAKDESVFAAFNFHEVMKIAIGSSPALSIIQAAEEYARRRMKKLVYWCQTNMISVDFICSTFESSIDFIASKQPWTMSWSNIVDYVRYDKFHDAARKCSRHGDTIHFAYSMNWSTDVFGTCLFDFRGPECAHRRKQILDESTEDLVEIFGKSGWDERFSLPLRQNPLDWTKILLQPRHCEKWVITHFLAHGRKSGQPCKVGQFHHAMLCPLAATGSGSIYFAWTHDPDIKFDQKEKCIPRTPGESFL